MGILSHHKFLFVLCACVLLMVASSCHAAGQDTAVSFKDFEHEAGLELYPQDGIDPGKLLGMYRNGVTVTLLSDPAFDMCKVRIGSIEGYMSSAYLVYDAAQIEALPAQLLPVRTIVLKDQKSQLNLREKPVQESRSLGQYPHGQEVALLGLSGEWAHVMIGEEIGFMKTSYLADTDRTIEAPKPSQSNVAPQPVAGDVRQFQAEKLLEYRGFTVTASLSETAQDTFDVDIRVKYPAQWTVNDDIISFGLYVNGEKAANIPVTERDGYLPARFQSTVEISGEINSLRVVTNWGKMPDSQDEAVDVPVN